MRRVNLIDFRYFSNGKARGLINMSRGLIEYGDYSALGVDFPMKNIRHLAWSMLIDRRTIVYLYAPMPRIRLDSILLKILFGKRLRLCCFVADLHFLVNRCEMQQNFKGVFWKFKRVIYLSVIKSSFEIRTISRFVQINIKKWLKRDSVIEEIYRVFSNEDVNDLKSNEKKLYDFYWHLTDLSYKGSWANKDIIFPQGSVIVVDQRYEEDIKDCILNNNTSSFIFMNLKRDAALVEVYKKSKYTLVLSKYEGFGFVPYEAAFFKSQPIVYKGTAFIEAPDWFVKLRDPKAVGQIENISQFEINKVRCIRIR